MMRRWKFRFICWFFDRPDALERRVTVERALLAHCKTGVTPTPAECRALAAKLGVPTWLK